MSKKKHKTRVRLRNTNPEHLYRGRDESYKNAPRMDNGRIIQGYRYKELLEGYRENGLSPTVINGQPNPAKPPAFVLQPALERRLVRLIRKGYPYTTVCRACGITPKTFKDWLEKGKTGFSKDYARIYRKIAKAEAFAEMRTLKVLRMHEKADWRVSAWQLERRWPENWSKKDRMVAEMHVNAVVNVDSKETLGKTVIQDEAARELARRLIDGDSLMLPSPEK